MSEPLEMSQARNIYTREREYFRRELLQTLRQYDSIPISFEIKQHLRMNGLDLKTKCLQNYHHDTKSIACNQLPNIGNSLRIRSMCTSELPTTSRNRLSKFQSKRMIRDDEEDNHDNDGNQYSFRSSYTSSVRQSLPLNRFTYDSTRRSKTNSHVLSFEKQLIDDIEKMIDSIDHLRETNRHEWLQPSSKDRQRQYFSSLYDDVGYSLPLYNRSDLLSSTLTSTSKNPDPKWNWKFQYDKPEDEQKTQVEKFYDKYLSTSKYLNKFVDGDDDKSTRITSTSSTTTTTTSLANMINIDSSII
ncbi:uncharacterized protein LOC113795643 [Dermatophagoides pteronyssinus]|uniref:uncharacterized protein LOC113795643 n=1 Tax=Dermatophagoides pteronyssinus TaxID=6956 RepID=UPI003F67D7C3